MNKNRLYLIFVGVILLILIGLFINTGHLMQERQKELERNTGDDELSKILRLEAEEYRVLNQKQQRGILIAGLVFSFVAVAG